MNKRQYKKKRKKLIKELKEIIYEKKIPLKNIDPYFGVKLTRYYYTLEVLMEK